MLIRHETGRQVPFHSRVPLNGGIHGHYRMTTNNVVCVLKPPPRLAQQPKRNNFRRRNRRGMPDEVICELPDQEFHFVSFV